MISIGVVFYKESKAELLIFLEHLEAAIVNANRETSQIEELIFVQNSKDEALSIFLNERLNYFSKKYVSLKIIFIQNTANNIGLARKLIMDHGSVEWVYLTDPDVLMQELSLTSLINETALIKNKKCLGITGTIDQKSNCELLNEVFKILNWSGRFFNLAFQGSSKKIGSFVDHAPTAHLLLNKSQVKALGNFSAEMKSCGEDLDLTHRATQNDLFIYFGSSRVTHQQNFEFDQAIKKFFEYGQAQAWVFIKNGFCRRRFYRLIPAVGIFVLVVGASMATKSAATIGFIAFLLVLLLKPQFIFMVSAIISYGLGTVYSFTLELNSLIARTFFRQKTKKSFQ